MARAGYADVVTDSFGNRLAGASIEVRQAGTSAKVAGPLYAGPTGAATLSNPFPTNALGYFAFYREAPEAVDLYVTAPGYAPVTVANVAVAVGAPVLDGAQLVAGSVGAEQLAAVPGAVVYRSTAQTIPHATETALGFDGERWDSGGLHDGGTPTRLVAPRAGLYWVWGTAAYTPNGVGSRELRVVHSADGLIARELRVASGSYRTLVAVGVLWRLAAGQYVELRAFQDSGGPLDCDAVGYAPQFGLVWVSP